MARRIIAVSVDETFGERLAAIDPETAVVALVQAPRDAAIAAIVDTLHRHDRVLAATAGDAEPAALEALAARAWGDPARVAVPREAVTLQISDRDDKLACLRRVRAACEAAGATGGQLDAIEQCVDELVENALFDAPVDADGNRVFEHVPPRRRSVLRTERDVEVVFGAEGTRFVVVVRDAFGTLRRTTVLRHLDKGLHAADKVERKAAGAGVGLFLVASAASALSITVTPGAATEIAATFAIGRVAPVTWLDYVERAPAPARTSARAVRTRKAQRRFLARWAAALAVLVPAAVLGARALPDATTTVVFATAPHDAVVELDGRILPRSEAGAVAEDLVVGRRYRLVVHRGGHEPLARTLVAPVGATTESIRLEPVATLEVDSSPTDAEVTIDGAAMGSTPLRITSLPPAATVEIAFAKPGYRGARARVTLPRRGEVVRHGQTLERSPEHVRVRLVTRPPGARVLPAGAPRTADRTYTPAEVVVARAQPQRFTLEMRGRVPIVVEVADAADGQEYGGELVPGTRVRFEAPAGTVAVAGAPHCQGLALPADCTLAPGRYEVALTTAGGAVQSRAIEVGTEPLTVAP